MAANWLKTLGGKILDTGAAYLQQLRLVQELRAMPPDQARQRFLAHVRELSASARAGLALTLATLASQERQADARRFLEMLRAALANAGTSAPDDAPTVEPGAIESPAPTADRGRRAAASPTLEDDLRRLDAWDALDGHAREEAMQRHFSGLDETGIAAFRTHMEQALENVAVTIDEHRRDEARFAGGRFIEDQQSYLLGRLAGAPPDADWLATLQTYERHQLTLEAVRDLLDRLLAQHRDAARPRPAAPAAPDAGSAPAAPASTAGDTNAAAIEAMQKMLGDEIAAGRVRPERAAAYERLLQKVAAIDTASGAGGLQAASGEARMQDLIAEAMPFVADPGTTSLRATPRARVLLRHAGAMKTAVLREAAESAGTLPPETSQVLGSVLGDLTRVQQDLPHTSDAAALAATEANLLRPAALRWHEHRLTRHALVAWPLWQSNAVPRAVNRLLYAGAADLLPLLEAVATEGGLEVEGGRRLQNTGQARWDALNACHVALFDLRRAGEIGELATHAPKRARELTGAAYELGLALALGKPVVVLASPGDVLPFDIDITPLRIDGTDDDATALAEVLDEAFYVPQRETRENAIPRAIAELDRLTQQDPRRAQIEGMGWLAPGLAKDPAGFASAVRHLLRTIEDARAQLLRPSWPAVGPVSDGPRCFHVMPYRPAWAAQAAAAAQSTCVDLGITYRLGKDGEDGCIVRGIWDDLCGASVVLVELAGGNLNVMIELGMAHALGRRVLAVQRANEPDLRPPHVEKLRMHAWESPAELTAILRERLPAGG